MPYRDAWLALEARRDDLRRKLSEAQLAIERVAELGREKGIIERELAAVEDRLATRRLRVLDDLRVASPCDAAWHSMAGDERVRFCHRCEKHVYNLSALTRVEAERVLLEREGSICVSLYKRADGTAITADCPVGKRRVRAGRAVRTVAVAGAIVGAGSVAFLAHDSQRAEAAQGRERATVEHRVFATQQLLGAVAEREPELEASPPASRRGTARQGDSRPRVNQATTRLRILTPRTEGGVGSP